MNAATKNIRRLLDEAHAAAVVELTKRVNRVYKHHKRLVSFSSGMGTYCFYDVYGKPVDCSDFKYLRPV